MEALIDKVEHTIRQNRLIDSGDSILIAVSGGPDSVALLRLLLLLKDKLNIKITAAHLDHGLRANSKHDRAFCVKLCDGLGVKLYSKRIDIKTLSKRQKKSLEEAGRDSRYAYFESLCQKYGFTKIATGHTLDDTVETVLLNLTRGAGLLGLAGIPIKRGNIIRPLLNIEKDALLKWLKSKRIPFKVDPTNASLDFARNRIRKKVVPVLARINPGFKKNIARLAIIVREEFEFGASLTVSAYENALVKSDKAKIVLDLGKLVRYDRSLKKKVLEEAFNRICEKKENLSFDALSRALDIAAGRSGGKSHLTNGIFIESSQGKVALFKQETPPEAVELDISDLSLLSESGLGLRSSVLSRGDIGNLDAGGSIAYLDYEKLGPITIRFWRKGDKIKPLGMKGTRLISDIFIDRRIPEFERGKIPIVVSGNKIAWIAGLLISDEFKVTAQTTKVLRLELCEP